MDDNTTTNNNNNDTDNEIPFPPLYESGQEDYEKAMEYKQAAADLKGSGDYENALEKYTQAILCAPPSALLYANRAMVLLELNRPQAAERDCDVALEQNPDSAKALRIRGKARKELKKYDLALKDLSSSQMIDFDEGTVQDLKFLSEKFTQAELAEAEKRNLEEEKLRKRAQEIKKANEDIKKEDAFGPMPGGPTSMPGGMAGMPGGMPGMPPGGMGGMPGMPPGGMGGMPGPGGMPGMPPGMPNMEELMKDPEIMEAMQNPKVMEALQGLMSGPGGSMALFSNPSRLLELMGDPDVGPVMMKLMNKFTGGAATAGGPGMNSNNATTTTTATTDEDEVDGIPNLDDIPDLDLNNLEEVD